MFGREAHGRSPLYETLAASVAADEEIMRFVGALPRAKQQPNLLFAAARYVLDGPPSLGALRTLVRRLAAAVAAARRDPPPVHRGDLLTDLPALAAQAPAGATLVVYHSAVLAYVAARDRERFARTVGDLAAVWLSNEAPGVVPSLGYTDPREGTFVLGQDGRTPLAFTDGHGTWLHWLDGRAAARRFS